MERKKSLPEFLRKKFKFIIIAAAIIAAAAMYMLKNSSKALEVEAYTVVLSDVNDVYKEDGVIKSGDKYHIIAKTSGSIQEVLVAENTPVKSGDVLVRIDTRDLQYQKDLKNSSIEGYLAKKEESNVSKVMATAPIEYINGLRQSAASAGAALNSAQTDYQAKQALFEAGAISNLELEASRTAYETARSAYDSANIRLNESSSYLESLKKEGLTEKDINKRFYESAEKQLDAAIAAEQTALAQLDRQIADCEVKAEQDGVVLSIAAKDISMVSAGQELAVISTNAQEGYTVESEVLTDAVSYLYIGEPVEVEFDLRGVKKTAAGKITEIYDFAEEGKSALGLKEYRVKVVARLDKSALEDNIIKDGYGVSVKFSLYKKEAAVAVPAGAVFKDEEQDYVFKIIENRAVMSPVGIEYKSGTQAVVSEGLKEGERVITNSDNEDLEDGIKVSIRKTMKKD